MVTSTGRTAATIFRVFQPRTWTDPDFLALSAPPPTARELLLFLMLGPLTCAVPGVVNHGRAALAEALGWSLEDFDRCFSELEARGFARADWPRRLVHLPRAAAEARAQSPNAVKSWLRALREMPTCALRDDAIRSLAAALRTQGLGDPFLDPFGEVFPQVFTEGFTEGIPEGFTEGRSPRVHHPSGIQKQKQKQKPEPEGFAVFWIAYPKKVGRKAALRAWERRAPDATLTARIVASVEQHKGTAKWQKDQGEFVPHPATFLNGELWTDELGQAPTPPVRVNGHETMLFEQQMAKEGR